MRAANAAGCRANSPELAEGHGRTPHAGECDFAFISLYNPADDDFSASC